MHPESSAIDEKQRNPLFFFYLSARKPARWAGW